MTSDQNSEMQKDPLLRRALGISSTQQIAPKTGQFCQIGDAGFRVVNGKTVNTWGGILPEDLTPSQQTAPIDAELFNFFGDVRKQAQRSNLPPDVGVMRALRAVIAKYGQQAGSVQTSTDADEAIAAGNGTLHGAIDHWQERALKAEQPAASVEPPRLDPDALDALKEFHQTIIMDGFHKIDKPMIQRLAQAGALESMGFGKHRLTDYGQWLIDTPAQDERHAFEQGYRADWNDPGAAQQREDFGKGWRAALSTQARSSHSVEVLANDPFLIAKIWRNEASSKDAQDAKLPPLPQWARHECFYGRSADEIRAGLIEYARQAVLENCAELRKTLGAYEREASKTYAESGDVYHDGRRIAYYQAQMDVVRLMSEKEQDK